MFAAVALLAGCGNGAEYAGLSHDAAAAGSRHAARGMREPVLVADMWGSRGRVPIGTWRSRNSEGTPAWLTIFRLTGVENDADQACVWAWRDVPGPPSFEVAPSVAYGRAGEPAHDLCALEARRRGFAGLDQTMGSEVPSPPVATPEVVAPFGTWEARASRLVYSGGSGMTLTGRELLLPSQNAPDTCGFAGFVIDEDTYAPIPGARVTIAPAGETGAVATSADDLGAFAFSGLPIATRGYDIDVSAAGYERSVRHEEHCYPEDFGIGDWVLAPAGRAEGTTSFAVER
jgi:hypothetical protein